MSQTYQASKAARLLRRVKWLVLALWVVALVVTFPFVSKLQDRLDNSYDLPASNQAQAVTELQRAADPTATKGDVQVVYENDAGLTAADRQTIARQRDAVVALNLRGVTDVAPVVYAPNGRAAFFSVTADVPNDRSLGPDIEQDILTRVRAATPTSGDLVTATTGSIAFDVDSNSANADQVLLIATALIVTVLLVFTYRSALLWIVPLISAVLATTVTDTAVYALTNYGLTVSSLDSSIAIVLVFGVATDYGMLIISRYREFLRVCDDVHEAVVLAVRGSFEAITASAATVVLALLALLLAAFPPTKGLGPVAAIGVVSALVVQMTFLPAMLAIGGRGLLWPRAPRLQPGGDVVPAVQSRGWTRVADLVDRRPRRILAAVTLLLLVGSAGLTQLSLTVNPTTGLRGNPPAVQGLNILKKHFSNFSDSPVVVVATSEASATRAAEIARQQPGAGQVSEVTELAGRPSFTVTLKDQAYSDEAFSTITALRADYAAAGLGEILVGGEQATQLDYTEITRKDNLVLIPVILIIVMLVLALLLRSVLAPLLLLLTVVLSFAGSFGLSILIFRYFFDIDQIDPVLPIYVFLFVVALGVDYNIFLMDRARHESVVRGVREGMLYSLTVTGGVITAAGLVLAGTFAVLAVIPLVNTTVVGVAVALGVLIDSFLVRSLLLPALALTIGPKTWWPNRLSRPEPVYASEASAPEEVQRVPS